MGAEARHYRSRSKVNAKTGTILWLFKWLLPCWFAGFGFYLQSVFLHYATYNYVHRIYQEKETMSAHAWNDRFSKYAALEDPFEDGVIGERRLYSIHTLDVVAGLFPVAFVCIAVINHRVTLQVWTKVMLCAGFLFTFKGVLGAMTIVPDSSGWETCAARLKPEGVAYMREDHTFSEMLILDYKWNFLWYHHPLRYCADMMYSGHTFVVTLFALGCYELLRIVIRVKQHSDQTQDKGWSWTWLKTFLLVSLAAVAVTEQAVEIYLVLLSRFHYSMDTVMALVITFLAYTNGIVSIVAKQWEIRGPYFLIGKYPSSEVLNSEDWTKTEMWVTRGDIFVPPCCVPCCCLAGREHIYSDRDIREIGDALKQQKMPLELDMSVLAEELQMDEGLSKHDMKTIQNSFSVSAREVETPLTPLLEAQV